MNAIFDYSPLWETMRKNGVSQYYLLQNGIDNKTLDSLRKNRNITMVTLEKLCRLVGCTPNDVVRIIPWRQENRPFYIDAMPVMG